MAEKEYPYAVPGGFPALAAGLTRPNLTKLKNAIAASSIATPFYIDYRDGSCIVVMANPLSAGDETALNVIIAAHDGVAKKRLIYHGSSKLVDTEVAIVGNNFVPLGGVVANPAFFVKDFTNAFARLVLGHRATDGDIELRIVEHDGTTEVELVKGIYPDSGGAWKHDMTTDTTVELRPTRNTYELQGRLVDAASASIRYASISLLERR